jgi:hypothetical protein
MKGLNPLEGCKKDKFHSIGRCRGGISNYQPWIMAGPYGVLALLMVVIHNHLLKPRCVKNEYFLPKPIDPPG